MFGGGNGSLSIIEIKKRRNEMEEDEAKFSEAESPDASLEAFREDIVIEKGIEINVSLPHKKVKELHAFSGGSARLPP